MALAGLMATGLAACTQQDPEINRKLDRILTRMDTVDQRLDRIEKSGVGGGRGGQQRGQQRQADPNTVYSVPIDGDPVEGPANAKVTIVEAADFA